MQIEHQDAQIIIRAVGDKYRAAPHFPRNIGGNAAFANIPGRRVSEIIIHHSAGGMYEGLRAVDELADYFTAPPTYKLDAQGKAHAQITFPQSLTTWRLRGYALMPA